MARTVKAKLVPLGRTLATPGALRRAGGVLASLFHRHEHGDWGGVCASDAKLNDRALKTGERILSEYTVGATRIWVITEADRSCTTALLPEEY